MVTRQRPIHDKPIVYRKAVATGELRLSAKGRAAIRAGKVLKGDPIRAAELAGILALKRTSELLPHCHPIPITGSEVVVVPNRAGVRADVTVEALWRTGVEMEALVGASVALLTVWDMVKYLEKDSRGAYPATRLVGLRVVSKVKGPPTREP